MSDHGREKLDIVFYLESVKTEETQIGPITFGKTVQSAGISDIQALQLITDTMFQFGMPMEFTENGKRFSVNSYLRQVEKRNKWSRPIEASGLNFRFGRVPALMQAFISIEEVRSGLMTSWADWVAPFLKVDKFVQAWITDVEYDYWQNAKDPLQYEAAGRSYRHLPTKSNELPPPLEQLEIDISNNPGRWTWQSGFIEAVGSIMWLSPLFWSLVGKGRKDVLLSANGFKVQHMANGITQVVAADHCFCDETTESIQRRLRSTLFDQTSKQFQMVVARG